MIIPYVETMLSYACTLSCRSCTNYSDYGMKGTVRWADAEGWFQKWAERVEFEKIGMMGGEPLINPDLYLFIRGLRKIFPSTRLRLITNVTLWKNWPDLLDVISEVGNMELKFSVHQKDAAYLKTAITDVMGKFPWKEEDDHYVHESLRFEVSTTENFLRSFKGEYGAMEPYQSHPFKSFNICQQKTCPLLYEGRIYKCSSIALLKRVMTEWKQSDSKTWEPYLGYSGIGTDDSDEEIAAWIRTFGKPEAICRMCPTSDDLAWHDHFSTVTSRI